MSELVDSAEMLQALSTEVAEYWPPEREMLATLVELTHALLVVTLKANGAKRTPSPLKYPRPNSVIGAKAAPKTMSEYAQMIKDRRV